MRKGSQYATNFAFNAIAMALIVRLFLAKHQVKTKAKANSGSGSPMIMCIPLQNTASVMSTVVVIPTASMPTVIGKGHKRPLNVSFDFDSQASKDLITSINHIFRRDKFKRFKHFSFSSPFTNQNKFKRLRFFTLIISLNIF